MTPEEKRSNWIVAGYMAFTLFIGAAWNDASPAQRHQLRTNIRPLLDEFKDKSTSPSRARQLMAVILVDVVRTMGDDWVMPEQWMSQIEALLR